MDPQRLKEAYQRLQALDDSLTHKVRPRPSGSMVSPTPEHLDAKMRDLARFTLELKEIVQELFHGLAGRPGGGNPPVA